MKVILIALVAALVVLVAAHPLHQNACYVPKGPAVSFVKSPLPHEYIQHIDPGVLRDVCFGYDVSFRLRRRLAQRERPELVTMTRYVLRRSLR